MARKEDWSEFQVLTESTKVNIEKKEIDAILIKSGVSKRKNYYSPQCLESAAPLFNGKKMYIDHPNPASPEGQGKVARSFRDWVATIKEATYLPEEKAIGAKIGIRDDNLWEKISNASKEGWLDEIGLSINAVGKTRLGKINNETVHVVESIVNPRSVDFVPDASAGGNIRQVLESEINTIVEELSMIEKLTVKELRESNPGVVTEIESAIRERVLAEATAKIDAMAAATKGVIDEFVDLVESETAEIYTNISEGVKEAELQPAEQHLTEGGGEVEKILAEKEELYNQLQEAFTSIQKESDESKKRVDELERQLVTVTSKSVAQSKLQESKLPEAMKRRLMVSLIGCDPETMDEIIQEAQEMYTDLEKEGVIRKDKEVKDLGGDTETSEDKQSRMHKLFGVE